VFRERNTKSRVKRGRVRNGEQEAKPMYGDVATFHWVKGTGPLEALVWANGPLVWVLYQLLLPLSAIGVPLFYLHSMKEARGSFEFILGRGVLLLVSLFILIGVFHIIRQARVLSERLMRHAGLQLWEQCMLLLAIVFVMMYGMNVLAIHHLEHVAEVPRHVLVFQLRRWAWNGVVGCVGAVLFGLCGIFRSNRALLEAWAVR
jgi:hypothetical protein